MLGNIPNNSIINETHVTRKCIQDEFIIYVYNFLELYDIEHCFAILHLKEKYAKHHIYVFDKILYNEFMKITESKQMNTTQQITNDDIDNFICGQHAHFQLFLKNRFEELVLDILKNSKESKEITKYCIKKAYRLQLRESKIFEKYLNSVKNDK